MIYENVSPFGPAITLRDSELHFGEEPAASNLDRGAIWLAFDLDFTA